MLRMQRSALGKMPGKVWINWMIQYMRPQAVTATRGEQIRCFFIILKSISPCCFIYNPIFCSLHRCSNNDRSLNELDDWYILRLIWWNHILPNIDNVKERGTNHQVNFTILTSYCFVIMNYLNKWFHIFQTKFWHLLLFNLELLFNIIFYLFNSRSNSLWYIATRPEYTPMFRNNTKAVRFVG